MTPPQHGISVGNPSAARTRATSYQAKNSPGLTRNVPWPVVIFFFGLAWPTAIAIHLGDLFLPVYRIVLLALSPVLLFVAAKLQIRFQAPDYLIVGFAFVQGVIIVWHHGLFAPIQVVSYVSSQTATGVENAGSFFLETAIPYLLARLFIRDRSSVTAVMRLQIAFVLAIGTITLVQAITGYSLFAGGYVGGEVRMGLFRSAGPFPHPILWGLFAASAFSFAVLSAAGGTELWKRALTGALIVGATITSASSAPMLAIMVQIGLILWLVATKRLQHRWWYLATAFAAAYVAVDIVSNRTPVHVLFSYATLSPGTGYYRTLIWEFGWANVMASPFMGIGLNDWFRPYWMNASVDAFWLSIMMRCGLIGFAVLCSGLLFAFARVATAEARSRLGKDRARTAWMIAFSAYAIGGVTVMFYNHSLVHFFFMAGLWGALAGPPLRTDGATTRRNIGDLAARGNPGTGESRTHVR